MNPAVAFCTHTWSPWHQWWCPPILQLSWSSLEVQTTTVLRIESNSVQPTSFALHSIKQNLKLYQTMYELYHSITILKNTVLSVHVSLPKIQKMAYFYSGKFMAYTAEPQTSNAPPCQSAPVSPLYKWTGFSGLAFSRPKNDKFGLFYIGWPGHFLEFIKYLAFFKVYRSFYSKIKPFFLF